MKCSKESVFLKDTENFIEDTACFFCCVAGDIAQLSGHTLDDIAKLGGIEINAEQLFDQSKRIRGELGDQILVSGKFTNEIRDDFLDIHNYPPCCLIRPPCQGERFFYAMDIIEQAAMKDKAREGKRQKNR